MVQDMTHPDIQIVDFMPSGNSKDFVREGWSEPEVPGTWSIGLESRIVLSPAKNVRNCSIEFVALGFETPSARPQRLSFIVNDQTLYSGEVAGWTVESFRIPDNIAADPIEIRVVHPDAERPVTLGLSTDQRQLAVLFQRLTLKGEPADSVLAGEPVTEPMATAKAEADIVASTSVAETSELAAGSSRTEALEGAATVVATDAPKIESPRSHTAKKSWLGFLGW
jgi:hypothetical protein